REGQETIGGRRARPAGRRPAAPGRARLGRGSRHPGRAYVSPSCRLELSAPGGRPAFDDDLLLRIEVDRVTSLGMEIAEEALFPAGEGEVRHWRRDAHVDANVADPRLVAELARRRPARGEEASHV